MLETRGENELHDTTVRELSLGKTVTGARNLNVRDSTEAFADPEKKMVLQGDSLTSEKREETELATKSQACGVPKCHGDSVLSGIHSEPTIC